MSQFTNQDYENAVSAATNRSEKNSTGERSKIGFFKLANDGDEALLRINIGDVSELNGVTVHKAVFEQKFEGLPNPYGSVDCLNVFGEQPNKCPFCAAAANGDKVIAKATKKIFVQMLVRYKDKASGAFSDVEAVVWERPYAFYKDLLVFLKNGSLRDSLVTITKVGSGQGVRYILNYAPEKIYSPDLIPADFSAFDGVDSSRFYFKKTAQELQYFVDNRHFEKPEPKSQGEAQTNAPATEKVGQPQPQTVNQAPAYTQPAAQPTYTQPAPTFEQAEANPFPQTPAQPAAQPQAQTAAASSNTNEQPQRNFNWNW